MKLIIPAMAVAAVGLWFAAPASAQLDVNLGGNSGAGGAVGNAVQGAGNGVQRATQGIGNATRGIQHGTRNIQRGVRQLGGDVVQETRQGLRNQSQNLRNDLSGQGRVGVNSSTFVQANTPQIPARAQADVQFNAQADRDARWRKSRHNGEWWYYSPEGNWMYMREGKWNKYNEQEFRRPNGDGSYSANYRAGSSNDDMWTQDGQSVYRLQADNQGRQFIRLNGQQIWVGSDVKASARAGQSGRNPTNQDSLPQNIEADVDTDASVDVGQSNRGTNLDVDTDAAAETGIEK